ncbi:MAG: hypothetical protein WCC63_08415 [Candidatus Bathyarchaeia archaeon]
MKPKIESIIELLRDGKWHTLEEISRKTELHEFKIEILTDFLADYSFIEFNKKERRAKSSKAFTDFLKKHRTCV